MKRFSVALMLVILALALLPGATLAHACNAPAQYPLYAGQTTPVGYVAVCNDGNNLTVTYNTTSSDWRISETHLAVGDQLSDIPQRNGNPPPGQFPYGGSHNPAVTTVTYAIPKSAIGPIGVGSTLYIAAHAVVWDSASTASSASMLACTSLSTAMVTARPRHAVRCPGPPSPEPLLPAPRAQSPRREGIPG